jgi:hypothetical protein
MFKDPYNSKELQIQAAMERSAVPAEEAVAAMKLLSSLVKQNYLWSTGPHRRLRANETAGKQSGRPPCISLASREIRTVGT